MIHIAICEDDSVHLQRLTKSLQNLLDIQMHEITAFQSAEEFEQCIGQEKQTFDIVFMDIELGNESGITLAERVHTILPGIQVIFISQYMDYVSDIYETRHIYFIHKNNLEQYLPLAFEKALAKIQEAHNQSLEIYWKRETYYILQEEILYIERLMKTTEIHTTTKTYYTSEKLSALLDRLGNDFALCHQSFIVNMNKIIVLEKNTLFLKENIQIPISRAHYPNIKKNYCRFVFS